MIIVLPATETTDSVKTADHGAVLQTPLRLSKIILLDHR